MDICNTGDRNDGSDGSTLDFNLVQAVKFVELADLYALVFVRVMMGTFPQYQYPKTLARYAEIGRSVGLTGKNDAEVFEKLLAKLDELMRTIEILPTIRDYGVDEKHFLETLDEMSEQAFNDQCTGANPRYPLVSELKDIYLKAYYGEMPNKEKKKAK